MIQCYKEKIPGLELPEQSCLSKRVQHMMRDAIMLHDKAHMRHGTSVFTLEHVQQLTM